MEGSSLGDEGARIPQLDPCRTGTRGFLKPSAFADISAHVNRATILDCLKRNEAGLTALGLQHVSLFGSVARGDASDASDVDLAVTLDAAAGIDLFRFAALTEQVSRMLDAKVDLVVEPARSARMQAEIDRDRVLVY